MKKSTGNRLASLEAKLSPSKGLVVIVQHKGETKEEAYDRHYAEHPEDRDSKLTIFLVRIVYVGMPKVIESDKQQSSCYV